MVQEFITFIIIGAAVVFAFYKVLRKMGLKRKSVKKIDYRNAKISMQHNCTDCSAECMLRNAPKTLIEKNKELCREIEIKQKL